MKDNGCRIIDSVSQIERKDWDNLLGGHPEGYQFYELLESSRLKEFKFYYLLLYKAGSISLIAPLFVGDLNLDIAVSGLAKRLILLIRKVLPRFMILKTLFCGSPFGEYGVIGVREDTEEKADLIERLSAEIKGFCKDERISLTLFKDFPEKETLSLDRLLALGFFRLESFPAAKAQLNFSSFEGYLKSLSRSTRKGLRRKIKEANSAFKIEVKEAHNIEGMVDDIYRLYLNTYHQGQTKFEALTKEFFLNAARAMEPHTRYFLYYVNGALAAFNLCFIYPDLFIDKFIGFDYNITKQANLYFISWCHNIEWCLRQGIQFYQVGQTDYAAKARLGAKLEPLYAYLRHSNGFMNLALRLLAVFLRPKYSESRLKEGDAV
jgi:hypothetical protein